MAIEVRIPTILRTHTGGSKTVEGNGDTLAALVDDLDAKHPGLKNRLVTEEGKLHRFVNVYVNDEDVRFTGALDTQVKRSEEHTSELQSRQYLVCRLLLEKKKRPGRAQRPLLINMNSTHLNS